MPEDKKPPRYKNLNVKLHEAEYNQIKENAWAHRMSVSAYLRAVGLGEDISDRDTRKKP